MTGVGAEDWAYIRTFRPLVEVELGDSASLLCYHGSPRSTWDDIRAAAPDDDLAALLGDRNALVMAGGHTHEQFVRRLDETIILNPGSMGLPNEMLRGVAIGIRRGRSMRCSRLGMGGCPSSCDLCRCPFPSARSDEGRFRRQASLRRC